jgi:hypothetical protein
MLYLIITSPHPSGGNDSLRRKPAFGIMTVLREESLIGARR